MRIMWVKHKLNRQSNIGQEHEEANWVLGKTKITHLYSSKKE